VSLEVYPLRLEFTARDAVRFPAGKPGNVLRGAFGTIFRQIACQPPCEEPRTCDRRDTCPYARIFEPRSSGEGPSGLSDWPRPFVFRAGHLDGTTVHPGDTFHFDLNIFEMREPAIHYFVEAFACIATEGLGPGRGRAVLSAVKQLDRAGLPSRCIFDPAAGDAVEPATPLDVYPEPPIAPVRRLRVRFLTSTELKSGQHLAVRPQFRALFGRARDRVSTLRTVYQAGPLDVPFREMTALADSVEMTHCEVQWRDIARRSTRTGQVHPLGGFVGEAEYAGNLGEFLPILKAAEWTGVGRHTVWGKGVIQVEPL